MSVQACLTCGDGFDPAELGQDGNCPECHGLKPYHRLLIVQLRRLTAAAEAIPDAISLRSQNLR